MTTIENPWPPIGQLFVEHGRLSPAQLEDALETQQRTGDPLGEILVQRGFISRIDLAGALSRQWSWDGEAVEPGPPPEVVDKTQLAAVEPVSTARVEPEPAEQPEAPEPPARQERVIADLQARLRAVQEQLAAGESRLREVETLVGEFAQACGKLAAQSDAQTREIEDLRRVTQEQAARMSSAAHALLPPV